jgi:hypothetical protein
MKSDLNNILTLASSLIAAVAALSLGWMAWRTTKRDALLSREYKVHVGKLMIGLRREYADRLRSRKSS